MTQPTTFTSEEHVRRFWRSRTTAEGAEEFYDWRGDMWLPLSEAAKVAEVAARASAQFRQVFGNHREFRDADRYERVRGL